MARSRANRPRESGRLRRRRFCARMRLLRCHAAFVRLLTAVGTLLAKELHAMSPNLNRRQFASLGAASLAALSIGAAPPRTPGTRKPVVIASGRQQTAEIAMEMIRKGADPLDAVIAGVAIVEADPNDHS